MVLVDIVVANLWLAIILLGIGRSENIDKWLKADNSAIEELKEKVSQYTKSVSRTPELKDYMIMLGIAFFAVGFSHWASEHISEFLLTNFEVFNDKTSALASFSSTFFWMITISTAFGVGLSFTKAKSYEGAGASKIGSIFIYFLVATIGMKMDLAAVFEAPTVVASSFVVFDTVYIKPGTVSGDIVGQSSGINNLVASFKGTTEAAPVTNLTGTNPLVHFNFDDMSEGAFTSIPNLASSGGAIPGTGTVYTDENGKKYMIQIRCGWEYKTVRRFPITVRQ